MNVFRAKNFHCLKNEIFKKQVKSIKFWCLKSTDHHCLHQNIFMKVS